MESDLEKLRNTINSLVFDEASKDALLRDLAKVNKRAVKVDFQLKRSIKDSHIAKNLLVKTIEDLEKEQALLAEANDLLLSQKAEIENKNKILIEQKKLLENQSSTLKEQFEKLEASYHELEQFSSIASHDLKSPLRSIAGFSQLLKKQYKGKLDERADEYIDFIVKSITHMDNVIRDLLEYSQMGKNDLDYEAVDFNEILYFVQSNLQTEMMQSEAEILFEYLPTIRAYETGIIQVFQNLISNAIKFKGNKRPKIKISAQKKGKQWVFSVGDNGIGLDTAYQEKVFLPFQQVEGNKIKGTGIGLAVCKKIVLMHKGEIWYEANPEGGTIFHFSICQNFDA